MGYQEQKVNHGWKILRKQYPNKQRQLIIFSKFSTFFINAFKL